MVLDSCKQNWFAVSCILGEVLSVVKASHPTVTQAKVRSENPGCYHCTALLTTINSSSNRSGIEVKRYDFSEPQAGKDLCDGNIAPCKERLRNYVSENHNIENARDIKEALESPPAMDCTREAVCKIDSSKVCPSMANNKITGILRFNIFSYDEAGVRVWQAYGIGEGVYFDEFEAKLKARGDGEWSAAVEKQRKQAKPRSNGNTTDPGSTYSCLDPACILTFDSIQDAEDHMDTGEHVFTPENEKIYDTVKRQWAAVSTTVKGKNEKIGEAAYGDGQGSGATKGWALKKQKAAVRILPDVKSYLTHVFNEGTRQDKAKLAVIAEEIKRKFSREEWLETQTIKGFFFCLAEEQKGQVVEEEFFDADGQESRALEREALLQELVDETQ